MEQKIISKTMQELELDIVHSYNKDRNMVLLRITPGLFDKIASEVNN